MKNQQEMSCILCLRSSAGALIRRSLWTALLLGAAFETVCIGIQVLDLMKTQNQLNEIEIQPRKSPPARSFPLVVFLSSQRYPAKSKRSVVDMYNNERQKSQAGDTVSILRNPKALDGSEQHDACVPAADWQSRFYPTCNGFHEVDFLLGVHHDESDQTKTTTRRGQQDLLVTFLGAGKQRDAWRVAKASKEDAVVVMKTLQQATGFSHLSYYRQVLDAIASERTTASPNVIDIYGFCGASVFNEIGTEFEDHQVLTIAEKLRYARDISAGLAALHGVGGRPNAMLAHGDIRRGNLMFSLDRSVLKLSDFNQGYFLGWNTQAKEKCGYQRWPLVRKRPRDKFSSPEETYKKYLSEKTDIYHLGSVIFFLLTGTRPYAFNDKSELDDKGLPLLTDNWNFPDLPDDVQNNKDPSIKAMKAAMYACYRYKMENRATAKRVYEILDKQFQSNQKKNSSKRQG